MRLIDADPLIEKIASIYSFSISSVRCSLLGSVIANAPTIDIVRCKECRFWRNKDPQQIPTANIMCGHMHPDDFCSYGERKESE